MKKFFAGLLIFLLAAALACYFLYPVISDQLCQRRDAEEMAVYREKAARMNAEDKNAAFSAAKEYNETLQQIRPEDVFTAGTSRTNLDYQNRLNIHTGIIGELSIPRVGILLPVYHLSAETPATSKLVHLDCSSLPADSEGENIVLAGPGTIPAEGVLGSIGLTDDRMLENLDGLIPGDIMMLNVLDRTMVYRVEGVQTLSPAGLQELDLTPAETDQKLTVISRRQDRRLLVQSVRIPVAEAREQLESGDVVTFPESWQNVLLLGSPVFLLGLIVIWVIGRIKRHAYQLPDEGRQGKKREQKAREKLSKITTETSEGEKT